MVEFKSSCPLSSKKFFQKKSFDYRLDGTVNWPDGTINVVSVLQEITAVKHHFKIWSSPVNPEILDIVSSKNHQKGQWTVTFNILQKQIRECFVIEVILI